MTQVVKLSEKLNTIINILKSPKEKIDNICEGKVLLGEKIGLTANGNTKYKQNGNEHEECL